MSAKSTVCSPLSTIAGTPEKCSHVFALVFSGCGCPLISVAYQQPINLNTERSCSFSGLAGLLWPPPPINNPTSPEIERSCSLLEAVGFLWASATAVTVNNPRNPRNQAFTLDFGCYYPPTPEIKRLRSFSVVMGSLYPPPPPRQPPVTPEIERECSLSVVLVFLWLPTSTTPKFEHSHLISGVGVVSGHYNCHNRSNTPPKSSANAQFRGLWVCNQPDSKIEHVRARFCCSLYSIWFLMYFIVFRWYQYVLNKNNFIG